MSSDGLKLPYGETADGRMVRVNYVARGNACGCFCPECGRPLSARQGEDKRWHFAHQASDHTCVGALETMTHKLAKQVIVDVKLLRVPPLVGYIGDRAIRVVEPQQDIIITGVIAEKWLGGIRPDVWARTTDGTEIAVEIFVAHKVDEEKRARLVERNLATVEIDLSGFRRDLSTGEIFTQAVLREAHRDWLHHPRQAEANAIVTAEWQAIQEERRLRAAEQRAYREADEAWQELQRQEQRRRQEEERRIRELQALQAAELERRRASEPRSSTIAGRKCRFCTRLATADGDGIYCDECTGWHITDAGPAPWQSSAVNDEAA